MSSNNNQDNTQNTQPNSDNQPNQTPYHLTEDYQNALKSFMSQSALTYKKDTMDALKQAKLRTSQPSSNFSVRDIHNWLKNPSASESKLRDLSNFLYNTNALYRWFITTIAGMPTWSWTLSIDTYGKNKASAKIEKEYRQALRYINNKNIEYEMHKAFLVALKEDFFYGYEIESDDYYFILQLDPAYTRISRQVGDGVFGIQFNFSYFDSKQNVEDTTLIIDSFPMEFQLKYRDYKEGRTINSWIDLDVNKTITLKMNDELLYGVPYFANLFSPLSDLGFYKDMAKERAEIDNFLLLHQKIPLDEKEFNKFAIDLGLAKSFDSIANSGLPDGVSMLTSPMNITAVKTERSSNDNQTVKNATSQVYTGAGIPQQLSNSDTNTTAGLSKAIMVNEQIVFRFYRQVEKIYNYKLKNKFTSSKLKFKILNITNFNKTERFDSLLKGANNGLVPPSHVASASGSNPYEFFNDIDLELNIMGLVDKLKPLKTSHTQSSSASDNEGGAPTLNEDELSDAGQITRDNDANVDD